jgi:hypothetical protein
MLRHVVMFRWTADTSPTDVSAIVEGLGGLPAAIPEIRDYRFGHDVGINDGNFDFVVVADFSSADDYVVYRDHPLHRALISERIAAHVAERAAVQFDTV